jgi:hypothetical protein
MKTIEDPNVLFEVVRARLGEEDDGGFWQCALAVLADEFLYRYQRASKKRNWVLIVGARSHWVRSHNSRWYPAGGFET